MCGIVGIVAKQAVNQDLYDALTLLQHRGQDAAGIATWDGKQLYRRKGNGLVRDVIRQKDIINLPGHIGIGHVRYPTAGSSSGAEAQPFYVNSPYGISLAHNGNLTNAEELRVALWKGDFRHLNTSSDSEVILNIFADDLGHLHHLNLQPQHVFQAIESLHQRCRGAYAVIAMINNYGIVGFRDPFGIRPLVIGKRETSLGTEYMLASESVALDVLGFELFDDVQPGEAVYITQDGTLHRAQCAKNPAYHPCIFEHVYLARPDSIIDKILVYKMRLKLGEYLANKIKKEWSHLNIDVVMPVPDTSRVAAHSLARELGLKYREGLVKNHYVGRTFIMPGQTMRKKSVRQKLNAIPLEFRDKNVLLVDDSIVRGTTSKEIIQLARAAGAKQVYFVSAAPPVIYPNVYGIDMPTAQELVAHGRSVEEVRQAIGADELLYQNLEDLVAAAQEGNHAISRFEDSVFTGDYVTGDIDDAYLDKLAKHRNDFLKAKKNESCIATMVDLDE
jgi:amidophosphoribosyltransferase